MTRKRLTKEDREEIAGMIDIRTFTARRNALKEGEKAIFVLHYEENVNLAVRKMIDKLPTGVLKERSYFNLRVGVENEPAQTEWRCYHGKSRRMPEFLDKSETVSPKSQTGIAILALEEERKQIAVEAEALTREVWAVLRAHTCAGKLLAAWPELEQLMPAAFFDVAIVNLPAVQIDTLRARTAELVSASA